MERLNKINKTKFADFLGITTQTLYKRIKNNQITSEQIDKFCNSIYYQNSSRDLITLQNENKELKKQIIQLNEIIDNQSYRLLIEEKKKYKLLMQRYNSLEEQYYIYLTRYGKIK